MKKEKLIEELSKLPDNCDVNLFDYRKDNKKREIIDGYSVEEIESDEGNFGVISFE